MDSPNININSIFRGLVIAILILMILLIVALANSYGQVKIDSSACKSDNTVIRILGKKTIQVDCDTTYLLSKSVFRKYTQFAQFVKNGQLSQLISGYEEMISSQQDHYQKLLSETKQMYDVSSFALAHLKVELTDIKTKFNTALTGLENVQYSLSQAEKLVNKTRKGRLWKILIPSASAFILGVFISK